MSIKILLRPHAVKAILCAFLLGATARLPAQTVSIDPTQKHQVIDGFGTCGAASDAWWSQLYFDDLRASILRMDITPQFKPPYSVNTYNSPWFHGHPSLPGPEGNNVRTYTNATDYTRPFAGQKAQIAVMGPDIDKNIALLDFSIVKGSGLAAQIGTAQAAQLGDFKLYGSMWSPAPWVKISSGNTIKDSTGGVHPKLGTPWPFIWNGSFAGGKLDVSSKPMAEFDDRTAGGNGPTSALTQYARCTAAYLRGFQNTYKVRFYGISIQNEVNFEEFYHSCTYPLSSDYIVALKAVRAELDKYPDLKSIQILGPEDLLGGNAYSMWLSGSAASPIHKNLHYLQEIGKDPVALAALSAFCIHGYANNGVSAAGADPVQWKWWTDGWAASPGAGIPGNVKGFTAFHKKSWMTETSGEQAAWLAPAGAFPKDGAWSIALKIHQALTAGEESAFVYWQFGGNGPAVGGGDLTNAALKEKAPKYVAAKHFFRYIRPNSVRVDARVAGSPSLSASAYVHEANRTLTVVLINADPAPVNATVDVPASMPTVRAFQAFTSQSGSFWQPSQVAVNGTKASVSIPGYGVVTLYSGSN